MDTEKQLKRSNELLNELMLRFSMGDSEENKQKQEEIDEVNKSIEEYEEEIKKLQEKLNNKDNYKSDRSNLINSGELLTEKLEKERETECNFIQECKKGQNIETKKLREYNTKKEKLIEEIQNIEQRLNKDELAKKNNIVKSIHLTVEEVFGLKKEIKYINVLVEEIELLMELSAEKIRQLGKNITESHNYLEYIDAKKENIDKLNREKQLNDEDIDLYNLRIDKDKLSNLKYVLKTLKSRLKELMYNPSEEIKKQIEENEKVLATNINEEKENTNININEVRVDLDKVKVEPSGDNLTKNDTADLDKFINKLFETTAPSEEIPNEKKRLFKEEPKQDHQLIQPDDKIVADLRTNAEKLELEDVQNAPEYLKQEKNSKNFKEKWNNWSKKILAASVEVVYDVAEKMKEKITSQSGKNDFNSYDNEEFNHKVLSEKGEYTLIKLNNDEDYEYIKYGEKQENVAPGITIKYDGTDMHIYYPKTKGKSR